MNDREVFAEQFVLDRSDGRDERRPGPGDLRQCRGIASAYRVYPVPKIIRERILGKGKQARIVRATVGRYHQDSFVPVFAVATPINNCFSGMILMDFVRTYPYIVKPMPRSSTLSVAAVDIMSVPLDHAKIKSLREKLGYTQAEAAERAGIKSRARWNDIERGRDANLTIETLERVAAALGVRAKDLLK